MKERPILFSGSMVRAILDGKKTQTRRIVKSKTHIFAVKQSLHDGQWWQTAGQNPMPMGWPYGKPGDLLWVRETFANTAGMGFDKQLHYAADVIRGSDGDEARKAYGVKWKPSIHMPRWASRINLEITNVRVERLQDISEEDALNEGATAKFFGCMDPEGDNEAYRLAFKELWESISGPGSWMINPWVWVIEFRPLSR